MIHLNIVFKTAPYKVYFFKMKLKKNVTYIIAFFHFLYSLKMAAISINLVDFITQW